MQFLFVSSGFCLQLPSDSASRRTPLPLANSSYCQACSGLSPPSYSPCRAHLDNAFSFGSEALPAPQAVLMSMIVDGIMSGNLPWRLIFIGAAAAATVELFGIGSLPFAVGLYLPITTTAPIMVGGLINGIILHSINDQETHDAKIDRGLLLDSGYIAVEALMGVLVALAITSGISFPEETIFGPIVSLIAIAAVAWYLFHTAIKKIKE